MKSGPGGGGGSTITRGGGGGPILMPIPICAFAPYVPSKRNAATSVNLSKFFILFDLLSQAGQPYPVIRSALLARPPAILGFGSCFLGMWVKGRQSMECGQ